MRVGIDPSKDAPETAQLDSSRQEMTGESVSLIDTDVHNYTRSIDDLIPHLSLRWKTYIIQGGIKLPGVSLSPRCMPRPHDVTQFLMKVGLPGPNLHLERTTTRYLAYRLRYLKPFDRCTTDQELKSGSCVNAGSQ